MLNMQEERVMRCWDPILDYTYNNFCKFIDARGIQRERTLGGNCIDQAHNMRIKLHTLIQPGLTDGFVRALEWPHWVAAIDNEQGDRFLFDPLLGVNHIVNLSKFDKSAKEFKCWFDRRHVEISSDSENVTFLRKEWNEGWTYAKHDHLHQKLPTQKELIEQISLKTNDIFFLTVASRGNVYDLCMTANSRKMRARGNDPYWIRQQCSNEYNQILSEISQIVELDEGVIKDTMLQAADIHASILQEQNKRL